MFVVSGSLSFIVVAASLLDFQGAARARFTTSVLLVLALVTLTQVSLGHRLPLFEGPSTPYLAMLVVLTQTAGAGPGLQGRLLSALAIAGLVIALVGWTMGRRLAKLFSPYVVGSFLFLLGLTLLLRLAPQAVGYSRGQAAVPSDLWALAAVIVVAAALWRFGHQRLQALVFLACYGAGLFAYLVAGGRVASLGRASVLVLPQLGAMAAPDPALTVLVVVTMAIPLVNVYASIEAVAAAGRTRSGVDLRASTMLYGLSQVLAAVLGGIGTVPRSESAGLVAAGGSPSRRPLMIAAIALVLVAICGPAVTILASFPVAVATDVLVVAVAFVTLIAIRIYRKVAWSRPRQVLTALSGMLCLAAPLLLPGLGILGVFLTNPILPGTILAIAVDQVESRRTVPSVLQRA